MQEQDGSTTKNKEEASVKTTIRNALSTLVTADFFVVCGFLLWFLVGIFCSSVLKDDTIQIAFNSKLLVFLVLGWLHRLVILGLWNGILFLTSSPPFSTHLGPSWDTGNFQAFVQPALGILMIASVAGNFFQEEEDGQGI